MKSDRTGEAWRPYYQKATLSWSAPELVTPEALEALGRTQWITRMLEATGLRPGAGRRILEAGCGTGAYSIALALSGFTVDAFDYSEEAVALARGLWEKAAAGRPGTALEFSRDNLSEIQSASERYDLVFNQAVLEYFTDPLERRRALGEMARVAKPGGFVAAIVQHTGHPLRAVWERLGWEGYSDQPPVCRWGPGQLRREFEEAGLTRVNTDGIYPWGALFFWPPWWRAYGASRTAVYLLGRGLDLLPLPRGARAAMATQILVIGRKP